MKNKILIFSAAALLIIFAILQYSFSVSATTAQSTVCAEHTIYGAWCQDVAPSQADTSNGYRVSQTSCQSTSYCATGTCVNTQTGTCLSSPQATCNSAQGGTWYSTSPTNTAVCKLGCCRIGDQASFTTQATCSSFSTLYGTNATFDKSINNEIDCIASAQPQANGACVYDTGTGRTCKFTTRQNCKSISSSTFHQDFLCTNPTLGTNCAMTQKTTCLKTSDPVYFTDSCGNQANVYDANRVSDINYWSYVAGTNGIILDKGSSGNIESATNGYCNYLAGSTCMQYSNRLDKNSPAYGNNICRSVNCESLSDSFINLFDQTYQRTPVNGESWCGTETATSIQLENGNPGVSAKTITSYDKTGNIPGNTEVLFICQNGQVTTQVSGQYRNKICVQNKTSNGYISAAFIGNRWLDCVAQNSSANCLNDNQRDCQWITGASVQKDSNGNPLVWDQSQDLLVQSSGKDETRTEASCVPKYPAGFSDTSTSNTCGAASRVCYVNYTQSPTDSATGFWRVDTSNTKITCLGDYNDPSKPSIKSDWQSTLSNLCQAQGDCGISVNYVGNGGANTLNNIFTVVVSNSTGETLHI